MDKSQLGSYICYLGVCIALMLYSFSAYALFAGEFVMATPLYLSGTAVLFVSTMVCLTLKRFKGCLPSAWRTRLGFGSSQNLQQNVPEVLRIRRTWQQNPVDSQSNASSNDDVIDMLITSRQVTNRRRRTVDNELGLNESQFVTVSHDPTPNPRENEVDTLPRDDPPPPYSEIAQEPGIPTVWMPNRLQNSTLGGSFIQQSALGGPGSLGRAVIQAGAFGGPIIQQSALGGPMIQSALGGPMIQNSLGGAVIQSGALGGVIQPGTVIPQSALCGTNETSFSNVPLESLSPNVIRGFIINSTNMPGLNIVCDNSFQADRSRTGQTPVFLNLELMENEVQNNELPSYEEYVKGSDGN